MRPLGKPQQGFEKRYIELYEIIESNSFPKPSFLERLKGTKYPTKDEIVGEWFSIQIESYETIKAPRVGRDAEANAWIKEKYNELEEKPAYEEFLEEYQDFYVIELAKELDGIPVYISLEQDENVFRGQFLTDCTDIIGEDLVNEAWGTKLAEDTLDYGKRLMLATDNVAKEHSLEYLKTQREVPEAEEGTMESKVHIAYSLAKWLVFYGKNGHGYEADY